MTPTSPPAGPPIWYERLGRDTAGLGLLTAWRGGPHADGETIEATTTDTSGLQRVWSTKPAGRGLLTIEVSADFVPGAPPLWFVNVDEPDASPAASNLVAFATDAHPPGTVVSRYSFPTSGVTSDDQVGAVRWYRDGLIHQVFVSPAWRRRNVGLTLLVAAGAWHQANGWTGHIHGDGRRTDLGDQFVVAIQFPQRHEPLRETMPPMDPPTG